MGSASVHDELGGRDVRALVVVVVEVVDEENEGTEEEVGVALEAEEGETDDEVDVEVLFWLASSARRWWRR